MIGYLEGQILKHYNNKILLKTSSGIAYEVYYDQALTDSRTAAIYTSLIIRENSQELFGFKDFESKEFFELLLGVKGVGPKSAYSLVATIGVNQMINAILLDNKKILKSAPGIGAKAAAQIILDLKDKVAKWSSASAELPIMKGNKEDLETSSNLNVVKESLAACTELGFKEEEVLPKINTIINNGASSADEVIKQVLQRMG